MLILNKSCKSCLIHSREFDAGIVGFENLFGGQALLREAVGADLAHADAVSPAATDEIRTR